MVTAVVLDPVLLTGSNLLEIMYEHALRPYLAREVAHPCVMGEEQYLCLVGQLSEDREGCA